MKCRFIQNATQKTTVGDEYAFESREKWALVFDWVTVSVQDT